MALSQVDGKHLVGVASKYVHFFHDSSLPLTDWYALYALTRHFRQAEARVEDWRKAYHTYFAKIMELKRLSQVETTVREMDHYLWLAGRYIFQFSKYSELVGSTYVDAISKAFLPLSLSAL